MNGYDKYLEFQYKQTGDFFTALFNAISRADGNNLSLLTKGFPSEVEAYKTWTRIGVKEFLRHISQDHRLRDQFVNEYNL